MKMKNFFIFIRVVRFSLASRYASRREMNGRTAWSVHAGGFVPNERKTFHLSPIRVYGPRSRNSWSRACLTLTRFRIRLLISFSPEPVNCKMCRLCSLLSDRLLWASRIIFHCFWRAAISKNVVFVDLEDPRAGEINSFYRFLFIIIF